MYQKSDEFKSYQKQWYLKNKKRIKLKNKKYYLENKQTILDRNKKWKQENPDKVAEIHLKYRDVATKKQKKRYREKYYKDINFKILRCLRARVNLAIKGLNKSQKTLNLLGCDIPFLWEYLEKKFKPGMSKENYGEWHIDHIIPCARFDLSDPKQQEKCFHYTNLQPLWARENLQKGSKIL